MLKNMLNECTGCSACYNICPANAITMTEDAEGFLFPSIDEKACTNCNLCAKICPVSNPEYKNSSAPQCYAFMASDEIRCGSSSGGAFPVLAYHFSAQGGYVAGAVWDSHWGVQHIISNKKEDIEAMRGSKYLQSSTGNCYKETETILKSGKKVLFTGTPCQIAGLYAFLRKDYANLYTAEIICHGTPSPKVFRKYLAENLNITELKQIKFRSKKRGWGEKVLDIQYKNKNIESKKNSFYEAFLSTVILRKSCEFCQFNKIPRQADLAIADFWGVDKFNKKYNDGKGTSVIIVNNNKGNDLLNILNTNSKLLKKAPIKKAINSNHNIIKASKIHPLRNVFFDNLDKMSVNENVGRILDDNCDCMILNLWYACNYGASLTCLGVKCLLEKSGMSTKIINYVPNFKLKYRGSFAKNFAKKYLNLTKPVESYEDLSTLNSKCKIFISGSDQVFASFIIENREFFTKSSFLLDFVCNKNKKISYAASFGGTKSNLQNDNKFIFSHFIKQFDAISIREDDGIDILKNEFGVTNAAQLIDGAFHIPKTLLNDMTQNYEAKEKYIACYVLPYYRKEKWYRKYLNTISEKLNYPIKEMKFNLKTPVEEWLAFLKNAEFVISDSYHAIVFSIIFNRPFIQIKNASSQSRFESLFRVLDIENNSISKFDYLSEDKILMKRDWNSINKKIEQEVLKAELWMKNAIETPKEKVIDKSFENFVLIQQQLNENNNKLLLKYVKNKNKYLSTYYFYKIIRNITFGKIHKKFKEKAKQYKQIKNIIKNI